MSLVLAWRRGNPREACEVLYRRGGLPFNAGRSHNAPMDPTAPPNPPVTPADVIRWCAEAAPALWFPSAAATHGVSRDALNEPLRLLRLAELVAVADWVAGRGQGYRLTPAGERAARAGGTPPSETSLPPAPPEPLSGLSLNDRSLMTREAFQNPRAAIVSPALMLVCLAWFAAGLVVAWRYGVPGLTYLRDGDSAVLLRLGALHGAELLAGGWWRLLAAGFVHVGAVHLLVNLFTLGVLGPAAENLWGRKRFAVLYFLSGLGAACVAVLIHPAAVTAGMSGSVWGVLAAVTLWLLRFRADLPPPLFAEWVSRILFVAAVNLAAGVTLSVSWEGHAAGAVVGFAAAVLLDWARWGAGRRRYAAGVLGLLALTAALLGGLGYGSVTLGEWKALRAQAARQAG